MLKIEGLVKNQIHVYETYKNTVMTHGCNIYAKSYDMAKATICAYPQSDHVLPHFKCVLQYCDKLTCVNLPYQETYYRYSDITPSIRFHICCLIFRCTAHGKITLNDKKFCRKCKQDSTSEQYINMNTRKDLVMTET